MPGRHKRRNFGFGWSTVQLCVTGDLVNTEWVWVKAVIQKAGRRENATWCNKIFIGSFKNWFLKKNKVTVTFLMSVFETLTPQCFAKAGKMEPNHLLNGFGPLQPAVAMLWWLRELLLTSTRWQLFPSADMIVTCGIHLMFKAFSMLLFWWINKPQIQNFGLVHFSEWLLPLPLKVVWYSETGWLVQK